MRLLREPLATRLRSCWSPKEPIGACASRAAAFLLFYCLIALARTWRIHFVRVAQVHEGSGYPLPAETDPPCVYRLWHEHLTLLAVIARKKPLTILVSKSIDGELAAQVAARLGYHVVRGSSSRGAVVALRELMRRLRSGHSVVLAADGPRGPRRLERTGANALARLASARLVQVEVAASPALRLPTWDRHLIPLPFARVEVMLATV